MADPMQQARELLAAEYERDGATLTADHVRRGLLPLSDYAVRAIATALRYADGVDVLIQYAEGRIFHRNIGDCPDEIEGHDSRDHECPVCRGLLAARPQEASDA